MPSELKDGLHQLLLSIMSEFEPEVVVLAGSLAEGRWVRGSSDVDLFVITGRAMAMPYINRFHMKSINGTDVNVALYTREEVMAGVKSLNFFILDALQGVPLIGDEFFAEMKSTLRGEIESLGITRVGRTWKFRI